MGYNLTLEGGMIRDFEKNILVSDTCGYFMPMSFVGFDNKDYVTYDCSGYTSLSRWKMMHTELMLEILERVVLILNHSSDYFILPDRITLSENTVFYNREKREVKIAYVPCRNSDVKENVIKFFAQMKEKVPENESVVILKLAQLAERNSYSLDDILNSIIAVKRKLNEVRKRASEETKAKGQGRSAWFER